MKHPLYETFQVLVKEKPKKCETFQPVSKDHVAHEPSVSSEYKKMGCLVLAGGQGTRLGVNGPKGCVELPLEKKKTLFQLLFEKVKAKGKDLSLALMTSPLNHEATIAFLQQHDYFGLTNVEVFQQDLIPMCDDQGQVISETGEHIAKSPDGNGKALMHLYHSGVWEKWKKQGVEVVQVIPVDNPLAEPFDSELLAEHQKSHVDLILKCIKREDPMEKLGVIGMENGRPMIREYSELTPRMRTLAYAYGNTGIFSCSLDFIKQVSTLDLPWHLARKQATIQEKQVWIWKFETFIFDVFPSAKSFKIVVEERKNCFAPLKNLTGPDSLETVAKALMDR